VFHRNREHIIWLLVSWKIEKILVGPYSVSNFWSKEYHHGILVFWDCVRIMAIETLWSIEIQNWGPWVFQHQHKIPVRSEYHHAVFLNFGTLAGLGVGHSRKWPWVLNLKWSLRLYLSYACKIVCFLGLVSWSRPDSRPLRPRIQNPRPYYWPLQMNRHVFKISALWVL
jgi:hypothetical protein